MIWIRQKNALRQQATAILTEMELWIDGENLSLTISIANGSSTAVSETFAGYVEADRS